MRIVCATDKEIEREVEFCLIEGANPKILRLQGRFVGNSWKDVAVLYPCSSGVERAVTYSKTLEDLGYRPFRTFS